MGITRRVREILESQFVDYVGFADIADYSDEVIRYGGNIVKGYRRAVSIGIIIPDSIVDHLPERSDPNVAAEYRVHGYEVLNQRLNHVASLLSSHLNRQGYPTLPIAAADRTDEERATPTVSHKMIAHIAGIGWIGKNCLLVTAEHGPRLRLVSLLTDAPIEAAVRLRTSVCNGCDACVKACPVGAIKGRPFQLGEDREERFDFRKCEDYLRTLRAASNGVCGMCLHACPYGTSQK